MAITQNDARLAQQLGTPTQLLHSLDLWTRYKCDGLKLATPLQSVQNPQNKDPKTALTKKLNS